MRQPTMKLWSLHKKQTLSWLHHLLSGKIIDLATLATPPYIHAARLQNTSRVINDLVMRVVTNQLPNPLRPKGHQTYQIFIPATSQEEILGMYHGDSLSAHQGANAMIRAMRTHVYWRGMNAAICRYVATCITCQSRKPPQPKHQGLLHPFDFSTTAPMEDIAVDHYGPLPETPAGHKHILIMVDMFT